MAYKFRMPYMPGQSVASNRRCPLCGGADSAGHLLGECTHAFMKAACIERHNEAARLILGEVLKGHHGNRVVCADIGSQDKAGHLKVETDRVPHEVLSDNTFRKCKMEPSLRHKLRPDALVLETTNPDSLPQQSHHSTDVGPSKLPTTILERRGPKRQRCLRRRKAFIVEVGYASETRFHEKTREKVAQHDELRQLLHMEGYEPVIMPLILGTTGGIFQTLGLSLETLGVTRDRAITLKKRLHIHSILTMHTIIKARRALEARDNPQVKRTKKPPDR